MTSLFLAVTVAVSWFTALAFVRLRTPLERLHASSYIAIVAGLCMTAAAFCQDGFSPRAFKCLVVWFVTVGGGALATSALGRAIHLRGGARL